MDHLLDDAGGRRFETEQVGAAVKGVALSGEQTGLRAVVDHLDDSGRADGELLTERKDFQGHHGAGPAPRPEGEVAQETSSRIPTA